MTEQIHVHGKIGDVSGNTSECPTPFRRKPFGHHGTKTLHINTGRIFILYRESSTWGGPQSSCKISKEAQIRGNRVTNTRTDLNL